MKLARCCTHRLRSLLTLNILEGLVVAGETTTPPNTTTALGTVSYTYDKASRPATMSAGSNPEVVYTFDPGNRLTAISSGGTAAVCIGYDAANRRTLLVLPDSVSARYIYDNASELTRLAYNSGGSLSPCTASTGTTLGSLAAASLKPAWTENAVPDVHGDEPVTPPLICYIPLRACRDTVSFSLP